MGVREFTRTGSPHSTGNRRAFLGFLRPLSYESSIRTLECHLEQQGIRTEVFDRKLPDHLVSTRMWPANRRNDLVRGASGHDAMIVLRRDAAVGTARPCANGRRVISGTAVEGNMNVVPRVRFPLDPHLEVPSVTQVLQPVAGVEP